MVYWWEAPETYAALPATLECATLLQVGIQAIEAIHGQTGKPPRTVKKPKQPKPRRARKTEPTEQDIELYGKYIELCSYQAVADWYTQRYGKKMSKTAVGKHIRFTKQYKEAQERGVRRSRSKRAGALPEDRRRQVDIPSDDEKS